MYKILAFLLAFNLAICGFGQQSSSPSKSATIVQRQIKGMHQNDPVSVIPLQGQEEFGRLLSSDQEGFTFYDVDSKAEVTLKYTDVKKVKKGYGGYNFVQKRHTDHTKIVVTTLITLGVLTGVVVAAAAAN